MQTNTLQGQCHRSKSLSGSFVQRLAFGKNGGRLRATLAVAPSLGRLSFTWAVRYINSLADPMAWFIERLLNTEVGRIGYVAATRARNLLWVAVPTNALKELRPVLQAKGFQEIV